MTDAEKASAELLEAAAGAVDAVFVSLGGLRDAVANLHREAKEAERQMTRTDVVSVRPLIQQHLRRHNALVAGAGVLMRPGLLRDAQMFVEWSCVGSAGPLLLRVSLDPEQAIFSDYDTFEWFKEPWNEESKRIVGPWVDYTGTGDHVLTLSLPIFGSEAEFVGVAGTDLLARQLEELALPPLRSIADDAALVNSDGRVIASNTPDLLVGSLLPEADARWAADTSTGWAVRADGVGGSRHPVLPWTVVVFPKRRGAATIAPALGSGDLDI